MRENRPSGLEGGESGDGLPYHYAGLLTVAALLILTPGCSKTNDQQFADVAQMAKDGKTNVVDVREKPISGDEALAPLRNTVGLRKLNLDNSPVTDEGLQSLGPMPELLDLSLSRTLITDAAMPMITQQFPGLEHLRLDRTAITDKILNEIVKLSSLKELSLFRTRVSDAGCPHIAKLSALKKISLDQTMITDAGLRSLQAMKSLESLSVWKTQVTDEAAEEFAKERPTVKLNR